MLNEFVRCITVLTNCDWRLLFMIFWTYDLNLRLFVVDLGIESCFRSLKFEEKLFLFYKNIQTNMTEI